MIKIITLIAEFGCICQNQEAMGKALGNQELLFILCCQKDSIPLSVSFGICPQVNRHIKDAALNCSNQLGLGIMLLEMQASQNTFGGHGLVVLYKGDVQSRLLHIPLAVGFHKISPVVSVDSRGNHA